MTPGSGSDDDVDHDPTSGSTVPPPFDPHAYARDSEAQFRSAVWEEEPATSPAPEMHARLRDSCKDLRQFAREARGDAATGAIVRTPTLGAVALLLVSWERIASSQLEAPGALLAALIDGEMIVEEILAVAHVSIPEGLAALAAMADAGLVGFREPDAASR